MGIKEFKEKIISDPEFGKKFEHANTPDDVVKIAKTCGFDFTVEDIKANTGLTAPELDAIAGGAIFAKTYFVGEGTIFAKTYFVKK